MAKKKGNTIQDAMREASGIPPEAGAEGFEPGPDGATSEMSVKEKIEKLCEIFPTMDPDDQTQFNRGGRPECNVLSNMVGFSVGAALRDQAWKTWNDEPKKNVPPAVISATEVAGFKVEDFEVHGTWMEGNRKKSTMWVHKKTRIKYFENTAEIKAMGLPIYPFSA